MNAGCWDGSESGSGLNELSRDEIHADKIAVGRAAESYGLSDCLLQSALPACWVIFRTVAKILIYYSISPRKAGTAKSLLPRGHKGQRSNPSYNRSPNKSGLE